MEPGRGGGGARGDHALQPGGHPDPAPAREGVGARGTAHRRLLAPERHGNQAHRQVGCDERAVSCPFLFISLWLFFALFLVMIHKDKEKT